MPCKLGVSHLYPTPSMHSPENVNRDEMDSNPGKKGSMGRRGPEKSEMPWAPTSPPPCNATHPQIYLIKEKLWALISLAKIRRRY